MDRWEQINAVQNMQDYIDQHLSELITLSDLSRCAGYSPFHCTRVFKEHLGKSPFEYIRALRLTQAALRLRDEKVKVLDVHWPSCLIRMKGLRGLFPGSLGLRRTNTARACRQLASSCRLSYDGFSGTAV